MAEKKNENGLTFKQQTACDLYRASDDPEIRGNAKNCYMAVYKCPAKSAEHNGPRFFRRKVVVDYLEAKREAAMKAADITEERILEEVACLAFLDPSDFYDDNGNLKLIHEIPERARRALAGLEVLEEFEGKGEKRESVGFTKKVKYSEKKGPLELLMKYKKMLTDKIEHSGEVGGVMLIPSGMSQEEWQRQNYPSNQKPEA